MAGFTTLASISYDMFQASFLSEITRGVGERQRVCINSGSPVGDVDIGQDVQIATFWWKLQQIIENICVQFYDPAAGSYDGQAAINPFTLETFRTAAGLDVTGGFRRVPATVAWNPPSTPTFSYGLMEPGDIIGPWVVEDLQAALHVLQYTTLHPEMDMEYRGYVTIANMTCQEALDTAAAAYISDGWHEEGLEAFSYQVAAGAYKIDTNFWNGTSLRRRMTRCDITNDSLTYYPQSIDLYEWYSGEDVDGLGVHDNLWTLVESLPELQVNYRERSGLPLGGDSEPVAAYGLSCPEGSGSISNGIHLGGYPLWIIKWTFTNA